MESTYAGATELAAAIRAGRVSATEVLDAHLARIARHNPALNAIVTLDVEGARERAREADRALARGEVWGPLHGVPFALKDAHATAGMRTTIGSPSLDQVPREDGAVAARLKGAGGILVGKTNVAMLLADYQTENPIFGRTNNPWDLARTPGGSSGGAAAAVAAGLVPFDIGTDLSASIRFPAHCCGVYGLKSTEGRVSSHGIFPVPGDPPRTVRIMSCSGPLARSVEDLALLYAIVAGPDGRDTDVPPVPVVAPPEVALRGLRVAFAPTLPGLPAAAEIRAAVEGLARQLAALGAIVGEAPLPEGDCTETLMRAGELIGMIVGAAQPDAGEPPASLARYMAALHRRDRSIAAWERFFDEWDALICPPSLTTAFPHCAPGTPLRVDGREVEYWLVSAHGTIFNYTGHPAVVLPYAFDRDGLPIGVQVVGKRWGESRLLGIARAVADVIGPIGRPPGY